MSSDKVAVNGDTQGWEPTLQDKIILELKSNGGIARIQQALQQRLDEAGWSEDLRKYCTQLFRSGEARTYDEAEALIKAKIAGDAADAQGSENSITAPNLAIPIEAQKAGAEQVKKEIGGVVTMKSPNSGLANGSGKGLSKRSSNGEAINTAIEKVGRGSKPSDTARSPPWTLHGTVEESPKLDENGQRKSSRKNRPKPGSLKD